MKKFFKRVFIFSIIIITLIGVAVGFGYWYAVNHKDIVMQKAIDIATNNVYRLDIDSKIRDDVNVFVQMIKQIVKVDGVTRRYLVLLQNNMELRPGGGFLGQFATIEILNGKIISWEVRDSNHLDKEIKEDIPAPKTFQKWLGVNTMKFRDCNWEMDFPTNAKNAMKLYNLGNRQMEFDGVIAVNGRIIEDLLAITGPIIVPKFEDEGAFEEGSAMIKLEDVVEKPVFLHKQRKACRKREKKTGIEEVCNIDKETGEKIKKLSNADIVFRKKILPLLTKEIEKKLVETENNTWKERYNKIKTVTPKIFTLIIKNLEDRDLQLWFKNSELQQKVVENNWGTLMDTKWEGDYLAVVDANIGALKSDYYIKRKLEYTVDFTGKSFEKNNVSEGRMVRYLTPNIKSAVMNGTFKTKKPLATMKMSYTHTAQKENYRTSDYHAYTRLYTPQGTKWYVREWFFPPSEEDNVNENKKMYAYKFDIFIGKTLPTMLQYTLPDKIKEEGYSLKIQKQSGIEKIPTKVKIITSSGEELEVEFDLVRDVILNLVDTGSEKKIIVKYL